MAKSGCVSATSVSLKTAILAMVYIPASLHLRKNSRGLSIKVFPAVFSLTASSLACDVLLV